MKIIIISSGQNMQNHSLKVLEIVQKQAETGKESAPGGGNGTFLFAWILAWWQAPYIVWNWRLDRNQKFYRLLIWSYISSWKMRGEIIGWRELQRGSIKFCTWILLKSLTVELHMPGADSKQPSKAKRTESISAVAHHRESEFKISQVNSQLKLSKKQYS